MCLLAVAAVSGLLAQDSSRSSAPGPGPAAPTRADAIEYARRQKAAHLQPDTPTPLERKFNVIENKEIIQRLTCGVPGLCIRLGGLITYSGFALGPEYYRSLLHDQAQFRASAVGSTHKFYKLETAFTMPELASHRAFLGLDAVRFDYPRVDYYGPGPNSAKTGRSDYRYESTAVHGGAGFKPLPHLRIGGDVGFLFENVGPGQDDDFVSTDKIFTEQTTPGLEIQSNFLQGGGFIQYDWRDHPGAPRGGGNYIAHFSTYDDVTHGLFSFNRLDLEVQQYFGFFNRRRVIAVRGRVQAADPHAGNFVPFYLQPTLGGPDDLRGFRAFRFYDNASLVLNGEYRWEIFSGLDMAFFVDAGRVFDRWQQINLRQLQTDYGFGFRVSVKDAVFMRIDTGFSHEGAAIWLKFGNIF